MFGVYLGALAFGAVLIGVTLFFGGQDFDADTDVDLDVDPDFEVDHADAVLGAEALVDDLDGSNIWLPFKSMRFYTFFTFSFGLSGTIMSLFSVPWLPNLLISVSVAIALGWLAAWSFRQLYQDTVSGDVGVQRFVGHEAKVLLPIRPGKRGKIVLDSPMGQIELPAETNDAHPFSPGTHVLVAHIDNGVANVTSLHLPVGEQHTESETPRPHSVRQPTK